jgi:hypothetical protein
MGFPKGQYSLFDSRPGWKFQRAISSLYSRIVLDVFMFSMFLSCGFEAVGAVMVAKGAT